MDRASPERVLAEVNEHDRTSWRLVRKLPGGYLQGAYELSSNGRRAVLKWHQSDLTFARLSVTAAALERARGRGWPTSDWLAIGQVSDGVYVIEEFVEGTQPTRLDRDLLQRLLQVVDLQAGGADPRTQDWSAYIRDVVFQEEAGLNARMRGNTSTADVMRRIEAWTKDGRGIQLATDDLVHGDFVLRNMVVRVARPYLIDAAHAGKGTRAYDLACLLFETFVDDIYERPDDDIVEALHVACLALVSPAELALCIACRMMHWLVFGDPATPTELVPMTERCHLFLDRLAVP